MFLAEVLERSHGSGRGRERVRVDGCKRFGGDHAHLTVGRGVAVSRGYVLRRDKKITLVKLFLK